MVFCLEEAVVFCLREALLIVVCNLWPADFVWMPPDDFMCLDLVIW